MIGSLSRSIHRRRSRLRYLALAALLAMILSALQLRADEPFARSRDYDLQHSKISLRFDIEQKKVLGEVTHSLSILREGITKISFDSVGLSIQSVTVNKSAAKFLMSPDKLIVPLPAAAKAGEKFDIVIRYEGKPAKGLYFILPDKDYPDRPKQIWTQGESEDTRYYLPTYDYPNDRLTTETILTVPASWLTVSNGKLISVTDAGKGLKTWTWKESVPSSTYLITVVAGEFDEVKDTWRGIPVTYYAPKGRGDRLPINYGRTPAMLDLFSQKFGVDYPWEKYAQVMVDDFVAGGMENSSATTNTSSSLVHPKLAAEYTTGQDGLDFPRTRPSMVRRPGHLQGLGRHLAQRRLCHLCRVYVDGKTVWQGSGRLRPLAEHARVDGQQGISGTSRSCGTTSTIPANSTATPTTKAAWSSICCAINWVKMRSIAASNTISK